MLSQGSTYPYSSDQWLSSQDVPCTYQRPMSCDIDVFGFMFAAYLNNGDVLEFCGCFKSDDGTEYWDNNFGGFFIFCFCFFTIF